jgi:uncharacterized iron-regulated protein
MRKLSILVSFVVMCWPLSSLAEGTADVLIKEMAKHDIILLGETHDNPAHHERQRAFVEALKPRAIVWEMLTQEQAERVSETLIADQSGLEQTLDWANSGWPPFDFYYPIFQAMPTAISYGGHLPRPQARSAFKTGVAGAFGDKAKAYGLLNPLTESEQATREASQMRAHCDAMPEEMLPNMVDIQRLRDAILAQAIVTAYAETGGPVAVITGSGHARRDWGVPIYLERVAAELSVFSLGQSEDGQIVGEFDRVLDSPKVDRDDPCAVFKD